MRAADRVRTPQLHSVLYFSGGNQCIQPTKTPKVHTNEQCQAMNQKKGVAQDLGDLPPLRTPWVRKGNRSRKSGPRSGRQPARRAVLSGIRRLLLLNTLPLESKEKEKTTGKPLQSRGHQIPLILPLALQLRESSQLAFLKTLTLQKKNGVNYPYSYLILAPSFIMFTFMHACHVDQFHLTIILTIVIVICLSRLVQSI